MGPNPEPSFDTRTTMPAALPAQDEDAERKKATQGRHPLKSLLDKQMRKTRLCHFYINSTCKYGMKCTFAHERQELQSAPDLRKTRICKAFASGGCSDENCNFAHGQEELRATNFCFKTTLCLWHAKGKCMNGSKCRFAHGRHELRLPGNEMLMAEQAFTHAETAAASDDPHGSAADAHARPGMRGDKSRRGANAQAARPHADGTPMKVQPASTSPLFPFPIANVLPQVQELAACLSVANEERAELWRRLPNLLAAAGCAAPTRQPPGGQLADLIRQPELAQSYLGTAGAGLPPKAYGVGDVENYNDLMNTVVCLSVQLQNLEQRMKALKHLEAAQPQAQQAGFQAMKHLNTAGLQDSQAIQAALLQQLREHQVQDIAGAWSALQHFQGQQAMGFQGAGARVEL